MTGSQKGIKVISILAIIGGILLVLMSILGLVIGGAGMYEVGTQLDAGAEMAGSVADTAAGGIMLVVVSVLGIITGICDFITAGFGFKAAKDASKAKGAFVWGIIVLVVGIISAISQIAGEISFSNIIGALFSLVIPVLYVYFANNIKKSQ